MKQLIRRAQERDSDAFVELMRLCERDMYRVAVSFFRHDSDIADAMQETALACFEHLPSLRKPEYFKTWLLRILINKCNDILRAEKRSVPMETLPEEGCHDQAHANMEFGMLMDALNEPYRTVLVLRYGEGLSVRQIGDILGITDSAVKQRLKRGRDKARELFEPDRPTKMEVLI